MKQSSEMNPLTWLIIILAYIGDVHLLLTYRDDPSLLTIVLWAIVIGFPLFFGCLGILRLRDRRSSVSTSVSTQQTASTAEEKEQKRPETESANTQPQIQSTEPNSTPQSAESQTKPEKKGIIDPVQAKSMTGAVVIPDTMDEISDELFKGNKEITSVVIPGTVKKIRFGAFNRCENLESIVLNEGLEKIEKMAFCDCGFREIIIPHSVIEIEKDTFLCCKRLEKATFLNAETRIGARAFSRCKNLREINHARLKESDKFFHLKEQPFLVQHIEDPANLKHREDPVFSRLTDKCASGDASAMYELASWFEKWSHEPDASPFYIRAANYWRYRAYCKGNQNAAAWFARFFMEHPREQLESVLFETTNHMMSGNYSDSIPGKILNDLGYSFFNPRRDYEIKQLEGAELVTVRAFESFYPPDEDGFGAEDRYSWWFLDENMQPIPGISCVKGTVGDTLYSSSIFANEEKQAIEILKQQK